jgi:hypothetical protein
MPAAFSSRTNEHLWTRASTALTSIQTLLASDDCPHWLSVLLRSDGSLILALLQSCIYLPASWRSPLWTTDLGAVLSERIHDLSECAEARLTALALTSRLALTRYAEGSGTLARARGIFEHEAARHFSGAELWSFRCGGEYLQGARAGDTGPLDELLSAVKGKPFAEGSLPARETEMEALLHEPDRVPVETAGLAEMRSLFAEAGIEDQLIHLARALMQQPLPAGVTRWIAFDHEEWRKRKPGWSQPGQVRIHPNAAMAELELLGVRIVSKRFEAVDLLRVLPARRFALRDRLPEMSAHDLEKMIEGECSAASLFDCMILDRSGASLWTPRVYRILDTIADLDPEGVQTLNVHYEGDGAIPPLQAFLPLPRDAAQSARQAGRKSFLARYIAAQIYSCSVVRRVRRAHVSTAPISGQRRSVAFTDQELRDSIAEAARTYGLSGAFDVYIERYGFDPFEITSIRPSARIEFGPEQMRRGVYVGIDIGGQRVKFAVIRNGELLVNPAHPEVKTPGGIEVSAFCKEVLTHVSRELQELSVSWSAVHGVGISWPGAVRDNRIVGTSKVLLSLRENGKPFSPDDPINRLSTFDFLAHFAGELRRIVDSDRDSLEDHLAVSLLNDGDAEAFGNHTLRALTGSGKPGGKIFVKLGTSLAGGRVTAEGAVAEEVAEYSKVVLNLSAPRVGSQPGGLAKHYISAEGIRNLSRTFLFNGSLLFSERDGANLEGSPIHIEPVELGMLLPLFFNGVERQSFLSRLVAGDNQPGLEETGPAIAAVARSLTDGKQQTLSSYIRQRGADLGREPPGWTAGVRRTLWLCTGAESEESFEDDTIPCDFPYAALARAIVGSVCLFSELGLHVAHLIAQLYNIYRRGTFSEVVLAGGVLGGESGEIVESQAKAFLAKYYDKIYGRGKALGPDTLLRATFDRISNPGVFGAAMAANRQRQVELDRALSRAVDERISRLSIGEELAVDDILELAGDAAMRRSVLRRLDEHFANGDVARTPKGTIQRIS